MDEQSNGKLACFVVFLLHETGESRAVEKSKMIKTENKS